MTQTQESSMRFAPTPEQDPQEKRSWLREQLDKVGATEKIALGASLIAVVGLWYGAHEHSVAKAQQRHGEIATSDAKLHGIDTTLAADGYKYVVATSVHGNKGVVELTNPDLSAACRAAFRFTLLDAEGDHPAIQYGLDENVSHKELSMRVAHNPTELDHIVTTIERQFPEVCSPISNKQ